MKSLLIISVVIFFTHTIALAEELSYSGRLVHANGSPVTGSVDLRFDLAYSGAPALAICSKTVNGVVLSNGVFHVNLDVENSDCTPSKAFTAVLRDVPAAESVVIQVTDLSNSKIYPHQALKSVPFSIHANVAKTISVQGTNGQVLKLVAGEWVAADGGGSGSVTEIQTGSGLSGGPITSTGTISIATNGVTSSHILDGTISNADINASAGIARSKIAGSLANHVVINDGAGLLSAVSHLPVSLGGTGAGIASDARNNLGLGNVATRDVGLNSGNVLLADEVPSCLAHQKIQKTAVAPYIFSCADDNDSADASKLPLLGGTMLGAINMGGFAITNLVDPTNAQDAATRNYVHTYVASELLGVSESQWISSGSDIYFSAGKVGIGTTAPARALHVVGDLRIDGDTSKIIMRGERTQPTAFVSDSSENFSLLRCGDSNCTGGQNLIQLNTARTVLWQNLGLGASSPGAKLDINGAGVIPLQISSTANNTWQVGPNVGSASGFTIRDVTNGANRFNIDLSGNVGIGSILPGAKLEVAGQVKITGGSPGAGKVLTSDAAGLASWQSPSAPTSGSIDSSHILDGSIVNADISASAAIDQSKIANLTTDLANKQAADPDLAALAALSSFGILVRDSSNSFVTRTLMGAAGRTFISNANGAGGNPTINISNGLLPSPVIGDAGKFLKATGADTSAWSALASGDITTALGFTPVNKAGDTMSSGTFTFNGTSVVNVPTPTAATHAVTKAYVDSAVSGSSLWTLGSGNVYRTSGNVGIGTATPNALLDVFGGSLTVGNSVNAPIVKILPSASVAVTGTDASPGSVKVTSWSSNASPGQIMGSYIFGVGPSSEYARMEGFATQDHSIAKGTAIRFFTTSNGTATQAERLLIDHNGNVGIGTTSPGFKLQVDGTTFAKGNLYLAPTNGFHWYEPTGSLSSKIFTKSDSTINGDLELWTSGTGLEVKNPWGYHSIFVQLGSSSAGGNVGIGTKTPGAKLEVAGQVKITGGTPGAGKVLTSDGVGLASWQTPAAGGITALTGEVTASGSGSVAATIANNAVTSAKILDGTIVDADIANTTITYSKLNLADQSIPVAKLVRLTCLAGEVITSDAVLGYRCVTDNATDTTKVPLAGGTMTGLLTLSANPTANLHAATKQYVDSAISSGNFWTLNSGNIYRSSNVGIGTTSAANLKLTVGGPTAVTTDYGTSVLISGTATSGPTDSGTARLLFEDRNSSTQVAAMAYGANLLSFGTLSATGSVWTNDKMLNIDALTGKVGIGTSTPATSLDLSAKTDAVRLPSGTTAQRPSTPANGDIRYNSTLKIIEGYISGAWASISNGIQNRADITTTSYSIANTQAGVHLSYNNAASGTINLPAISGLADGWQVTIIRKVPNAVTIIPNGADTFVNGMTILEMQGSNIQSITLMNNNGKWAITNKTDDCIVGQSCWATNQIYVGSYNGHQYFTTPGGCTDSDTPTCAGGMDSVTKAWATTAPESNTSLGLTNVTDGQSQSATLAGYATAQAAQFCENMTYAGYTDWYLPAKQELNLLYQTSPNIGGFIYSNSYWSSTESTLAANAWYFGFGLGSQASTAKTNTYYVRCVRKY